MYPSVPRILNKAHLLQVIEDSLREDAMDAKKKDMRLPLVQMQARCCSPGKTGSSGFGS
jgi:hypothetical protein